MHRRFVENEDFESEFIGASVQQCQTWLLAHQAPKTNWITDHILLIADARSARDDTLLATRNSIECMPFAFCVGDGEVEITLPQKPRTWYDFRIHYTQAADFYTDFDYGQPEDVYPTYFLRREELTDDEGVFHVEKAAKWINHENGDPWPEGSVPGSGDGGLRCNL
jgi:hypothetical protein